MMDGRLWYGGKGVRLCYLYRFLFGILGGWELMGDRKRKFG